MEGITLFDKFFITRRNVVNMATDTSNQLPDMTSENKVSNLKALEFLIENLSNEQKRQLFEQFGKSPRICSRPSTPIKTESEESSKRSLNSPLKGLPKAKIQKVNMTLSNFD